MNLTLTLAAGLTDSVEALPIVISILSFIIALTALIWQITKHMLDGGRVRVYLRATIWEPDIGLATNYSGKFLFRDGRNARAVLRGKALEMAQLVVENPGRIPITIHTPALAFSGHGKRRHSIGPRMFEIGLQGGPDVASTETMTRIEPYGRVTFLLDLWSVLPGVVDDARQGKVAVRGQVDVAGKRKPQKSSWRRRWKFDKSTYTMVEGNPEFTPFSVLWGQLFRHLPSFEKVMEGRKPGSSTPLTRDSIDYYLEGAMSRFQERPEPTELVDAVKSEAIAGGIEHPIFGTAMLSAISELDRFEGHLTGWTVGLSDFVLNDSIVEPNASDQERDSGTAE